MTRRGTTDSTGNLGGSILILVKNGLTYFPLSTPLLSSFDPSSDYLAITVKIKEASPIHLFSIYVPPIRSSSSESCPKSFSPFLLPSSPTTRWSKFFTLAGHFSKLFELAGLSRLEIVPNHGVF